VATFRHCDPTDLRSVLVAAGRYRCALVAIDGVYSMSGQLPPLRDLNEVALRHNAVLYVDDAHATGVVGTRGRGTVLDGLGSYANALVVGSLSKAFSALGGFVGCTEEMKRLLKMRSNTYIFGGPVPPPYLEAVCAVCDLLLSNEYDLLAARLRRNLDLLSRGLRELGLVVEGGVTPIVSVLVGDEEKTLEAGWFLFERGYYVQSVTFPAVPYHAGALRIQVNANHAPQAVAGLVEAMRELQRSQELPRREEAPRRAA
jgi:7-keto-8-aminopelargonate synthetase-like enzyme